MSSSAGDERCSVLHRRASERGNEASYSLLALTKVTSGAVAEIQPMVSPLKGDYEMEAENFTAQAWLAGYGDRMVRI